MKWTFIICLSLFGVRLLAQPDTLWTRAIGGRSRDKFMDIIQTSDGGYATGGSYYNANEDEFEDLYIVKIDPNGEEQWSNTFGGELRDYG